MVAYPTILQPDISGLMTQLRRLSLYFSHFQIDVCDGDFVPGTTARVPDLIEAFRSYSLPTFKPLSFEFHLMVKEYEKEIRVIETLRNTLQVTSVLVHVALNPDYEKLTRTHRQFPFGLVLNIEDSVETLMKKYKIQNIPYIQIMSIKSGAQGNPFIPEALKKIEQLRANDYRNKILLDGSVNEHTIPQIKSLKFPPDAVCPGSFLRDAKTLDEHISFLKTNEIVCT